MIAIIVAARVIIVDSVWCCCDLTAVWWVPDHLSLLRIFMSGWIVYSINNCRNESVLFVIKFVYGDWISCTCGFSFLAKSLIYRLFYLDLSIYIVGYCSWVVTIILSHTTCWDHLCQPHFTLVSIFLCLVLCGLLYHPYRDLLCLQMVRLCLLLLLFQLGWPTVSVHTFLTMDGFMGKGVIWMMINVWKLSQI